MSKPKEQMTDLEKIKMTEYEKKVIELKEQQKKKKKILS